MIIGAGQQFPKNNSHCVIQLKFQNSSNYKVNTAANGSGLSITDKVGGSPAALSQGTHTGDLAGLGKYCIFPGGAGGIGRSFELADNSKIRIGYQPFTLCGWYQSIYNSSCSNICNFINNKYYTVGYNGNFNYGIGAVYSDRDYLAGTTCDETTNIERFPIFNNYSINKFSHFAVCRKSTGTNQVFSFLDGVLKGTSTISKYLKDNNAVIELMSSNDYYYFFKGYMSNFTLIIGECLWDRSFTPPKRQA